MHGCRRALTLLALTVLGAVALAAPAQGAQVGLNVDGLPPAQAISQAQVAGAQVVRTFVRWDEVEPVAAGTWAPGPISRLDQLTAAASAAGIQVVVVVLGSPAWSGSSDRLAPPADPASYARFLRVFAMHYRGRVAGWEIWNEPDGTEFWHGPQPSDHAYAALLQAAYPAIKAADPAAQVYAGPLVGNDYEYLERLYADGAGGSFDAVAVHTDTACSITPPDSYYRGPDGRVGQYSFLGFREVHAVMEAHGDGAKPIVMSELGWAATSTPCARGASAGKKAAGVSEATQAANLRLAYHCLADYPYVTSAMWFSLKDLGTADQELNRYGLLRSDMSQRPAFGALLDIGHHGDRMTGGCGDFTAPTIEIQAPTAGAQFDRHLPISVSATDGQSKLGRITLYANGRKIRSFTKGLRNGRVVGIDWMGARSLPQGPVTITVEALDMFGNTAKAQVEVVRTDVRSLPEQATRLNFDVGGSGLTRTVEGSVEAPGTGFPVTGRVHLSWQFRGKAGWKTLHRASRPAGRPFSYEQRLARPGRWRVVVEYLGDAPFAGSTATSDLLEARAARVRGHRARAAIRHRTASRHAGRRVLQLRRVRRA